MRNAHNIYPDGSKSQPANIIKQALAKTIVPTPKVVADIELSRLRIDKQRAERSSLFVVLVIDDWPFVSSSMSFFIDLLELDVALVSAKCWQDGVLYAETLLPTLIMGDIQSPGMIDGFEGIAILRNTPTTRDIPIVIHSAFDGKDYEKLALDLGATEYVCKWFDPDELRALLDKYRPPKA
jgi:CheY-like chemotaxis protein